MKVVLVLLLFSLSGILSQTSNGPSQDPCSRFSSKAECTSNDSASPYACTWDYGVSCDRTNIGFCRINSACGDQLTCAYNSSSPSLTIQYFTFHSSCIPYLWKQADPVNCRCQDPNVCTPACDSCSYCKNSQCVAYPNAEQKCAPKDVATSADQLCPVGYRCEHSACHSYCVPECPDGTPQVQCLINPCDAPRPEGCDPTAKCVPSYCGGCKRTYYDVNGDEVCNVCEDGDCGPPPPGAPLLCPDGSTGGITGKCIRTNSGDCKFEYRECPSNCTATPCLAVYCPYGYLPDGFGCPTCQCRVPPDCDKALCPQIRCAENTYPYIPPGECCPSCSDPCEAVKCPTPICPAGTQYVRYPGKCCGDCIPVKPCSGVTCPQETKCLPNQVLVKKDCCVVCENRIDCSLLDCATVDECPKGFKKVAGEGGCCPRCEPIPVCDQFTCAAVACPFGTQAVTRDLECCPRCDPIDICKTVLCVKPDCDEKHWITRKGACCPQCRYCEDTRYNSVKLCDLNDDTQCRAGYWKGNDCVLPVPPTDRTEVVIYVKLCPPSVASAQDCKPYDEQTMRLLIAKYTDIPGKHIVASFEEKPDPNSCCFRFKIIVSDEKTGGEIDPEAQADDVVEQINTKGAADGMSVESHEDGTATEDSSSDASSSVQVVVAVAAIGMAIASL